MISATVFRQHLPALRHILLAAALTLLAAATHAEGNCTDCEAWRAKLVQTRQLAENNAPLALEEAQHLQKEQPANALPTDRIRLLNLLARIEAYLSHPVIAAQYAENALKQAEEAGDATGQVEALLSMMLYAVHQGRIDRLRTASETLVPLLDKVKDQPRLQVEAMQRTSMLYFRHGQLAAALALALQTSEIAERSGDPMANALAQQGMAIAYEQSNMADKALEHYSQMRDHARAASSLLLEAYAVNGIAQMTANLGNLTNARQIQIEAIEMMTHTGMPGAISHTHFALANILRQQGKLVESIRELDRVIAIHQKNPDGIGLWWGLNARAGDLLALGRVDEAASDADAAYAIAKKLDFPLYLAESGKRLAAVSAACGDHKLAYAQRMEADAMTRRAERDKASELMLTVTERFQSESKQRKIDELLRDEEEDAHKHRELWLWLLASLSVLSLVSYLLWQLRRSHRDLQQLSTELQRSNNRIQATLDAIPDMLFDIDIDGVYHDVHAPRSDLLVAPDTSLIGRSIDEMLPPDVVRTIRVAISEANEKGISSGHEYSIELPQGTFWFELSIARKTVIGNTSPRFIALVRDISEHKLRERELAESRDLLRQMSARRDTVREEERKHIAREIHDELGQLLTAQRLGLSTLRLQFGENNPLLAERCLRLMQITDQSIQSVRNIATTLRPAALDMGVEAALEWLTNEFQARVGVTCCLQLDFDQSRLNEAQSVALFRIVQESLTNVARYADASKVDISLVDNQGGYLLTVRDNGKGFDVENKRSRSFGLVGMRERALSVNGDISIQSQPGKGTSVEFHLPVDPD
jgi:signal transduction histidine kinase